MNIVSHSIKDKKIIELSDVSELDLFNSKKLGSFLDGLMEDQSKTIILDLHSVDYMDSSALGLLIGFKKRFNAQNKELALCNVTEKLLKIMQLASLHKYFTIVDDTKEINPQI